jgi:hypothetical protein
MVLPDRYDEKISALEDELLELKIKKAETKHPPDTCSLAKKVAKKVAKKKSKKVPMLPVNPLEDPLGYGDGYSDETRDTDEAIDNAEANANMMTATYGEIDDEEAYS